MLKHSESLYLPKPHKIEGTPKKAKERFYEMAKSHIAYLTKDEMIKFGEQATGEDENSTTGLKPSPRTEARGFPPHPMSVLRKDFVAYRVC